MELLGGILYVSFADLEHYGCDSAYVKVALSRSRSKCTGSWKHIDHPTDRRKCLIQYDSIPATTVKAKNLPSQEELIQQITIQKDKERLAQAQVASYSILSEIKVDTDELSDLLGLTEETTAHQSARLCAWYRFLLEVKPSRCKQLGFPDKESLYDACLEQMAQEHKNKLLPGKATSNKRVLKRKVQAYKTEGVGSVLTKKAGNTNAKKLTDMQENLLLQLYSDFHKPDFDTVYRIFTDECTRYNWPLVSLSTVKNHLNKPEVRQVWYLQRNGYQAWRNIYDPVIRRQAPSYANAFWVMDGTPLELYYRSGKTAYNRFEIFVVLDAFSWKVVGYSIGRSENTGLVRQALRMACRETGCLPQQLQYDNSSAIKSAESQTIIKKLATYCTPAQVGNARSKVIEPFFKHLNQRVLKYFDNYSGSNITAKSINSHINRDALKENFDKIPTEIEAIEQMHSAIAFWNNQIGFKSKTQSPEMAYAASLELTQDKQMKFTEALEVDAFYNMSENPYQYTNRGFEITYRKEKYYFDVEDSKFRAMNLGASFHVKFDPERMDRIYLYQMGHPVLNEFKRHVSAKAKTELPMAIVDRKAGDQENYNRLAALKDDQLNTVKSTFNNALNALPEDLKQGITIERVHKNSINAVRKNLKALEIAGEKTTPMPVIRQISLYDNDDDEGELVIVNG